MLMHFRIVRSLGMGGEPRGLPAKQRPQALLPALTVTRITSVTGG